MLEWLAVVVVSAFEPSPVVLDDLTRYGVRFDRAARDGLSAALPAGLRLPHDLAVREERRQVFAGETVVRVAQMIGGLRVHGAGGVIVLDASGVIRRIDHRFVDVPGPMAPPVLSAGQAVAAGARALTHLVLPDDARQASAALVVYPSAPARLAYEAEIPSYDPTDRITAVIDAASGAVLATENARRDAQVSYRVYQTNPIENPATIDATAVVTSSSDFTGAKITTKSCLQTQLGFWHFTLDDTGRAQVKAATGVEIATVVIPACLEQGMAAPAQAATYLPLTTPTSAPDPFAETHFYYHADRVARWFAGVDVSGLDVGYSRAASSPLQGTVGFALATPLSIACTSAMYVPPTATDDAAALEAALSAFNNRANALVTVNGARVCKTLALGHRDFAGVRNAFYLPAVSEPKLGTALQSAAHAFDSLAFGFDDEVNYAYDGNVVYHEYTHAVVDDLGAIKQSLLYSNYGLSAEPGAMNEGLADYFSAAITGEPCIAEYIGSARAGKRACLRNLDNASRCPDAMWGEEHYDSQPFSAALWHIRVAEAADGRAAAFDQAVFRTMAGLTPNPHFTAFMKDLLTQMASGGLDTARAQEIMAQHNVLTCVPETPLNIGSPSNIVYLRARPDGQAFMPGFMQYQVTVPPWTKSLAITLTPLPAGALDTPDPLDLKSILAGPAEPPDVRVVLHKGGPVAYEYPFKVTSGQSASLVNNQAVVEVDDTQGGPYAIALTNYNASEHYFRSVTVTVAEKIPPPPDPQFHKGCASAGGGDSALIAVLGLLALVRRAQDRLARGSRTVAAKR